MKKIIKKTADGNRYCLTTQNFWVRDITTEGVPFVDINKTISSEDYFTFLQNEVQNGMERNAWIDTESFDMRKVVIVSDGYDFENKIRLLEKLPKDVTIIGVNGALTKWSLSNRNLNWYVVNNPYDECMRFLPRRNRTLPRCIFSPRTNSKFISAYKSVKYKYYPVNEKAYCTLGKNEVAWQVDDYRNPICAAITLAYRFGVEKIMLLCCDDSFKTERPGSQLLENGLYQYPQQSIAHGIIDNMFYWIKNHPIYDYDIADHSSGQKFENATYIDEEGFLPFFNKVGEKNEKME